LLDLDVMERNVLDYAEVARECKVAIRSHAKTPKAPATNDPANAAPWLSKGEWEVGEPTWLASLYRPPLSWEVCSVAESGLFPGCRWSKLPYWMISSEAVAPLVVHGRVPMVTQSLQLPGAIPRNEPVLAQYRRAHVECTPAAVVSGER
jgi:hypothetical protein